MLINVAGSITSAGSTALDVLEESPGVIVDTNKFMPLNIVVQMLARMSADNLEKIEIITNGSFSLSTGMVSLSRLSK
ncbi:hypothetical protein [Segetibacter koreensis]|uniref:hypothetical protein n=1 Tax=Segetibacter koreensis TaxID=398037 RepID=UPI00037B7BBD|nr:hypothetical protein [Segetibacter koreensis]